MILKKNKKGSHVGIILSFTLFITFLIFAYIIIGPPVNLRVDKTESIILLKNSIIQEVSEEIMTIRSYDTENSGNCVQTQVPENSFSNPTVFAVDSNENEIESKILSGNLLIEGGKNLTKIYFSNNSFSINQELASSSCTSITIDNLLNEKRVTEKAILNLINELNQSYESTKNNLGISLSEEISILFDYLNGTIIGEEDYEVKSDIYASSMSLDYISLKGKEKVGEVVVRVW